MRLGVQGGGGGGGGPEIEASYAWGGLQGLVVFLLMS